MVALVCVVAGSIAADGEFLDMNNFAERYAAAWCGQDPAAVAAFFSEGGSLTVNSGEPAVGREAIAAAARSYMTAFPDHVLTFDKLEERDGRTHFHWTFEGTNTGPGGTGARVRFSGYEDWLIGDDGLIQDSQGNYDEADYPRQLRAGPATD
ncbi:MAG: nuclear transport factor 2 family protein [Thermoanaerobaculia bacterium]